VGGGALARYRGSRGRAIPAPKPRMNLVRAPAFWRRQPSPPGFAAGDSRESCDHKKDVRPGRGAVLVFQVLVPFNFFPRGRKPSLEPKISRD